MNTFKGIIIKKEEKSGTSSKGEWKAFTYVIQEEGEQYPQIGCFEVFGDKLPELEEGTEVEVHYSLKANEYNEKWYNKLQIWKVDLLKEVSKTEHGKAVVDDGDDLPF